MADTLIADFSTGRAAEGVFAVLKSQRRMNRNGDPYLVLELADSSGTIEGRVWDDADYFAGAIKVGDRVRAVGKASEFRGQRQFDIRRIEREEATEGDAPLIPMARRDAEELAGELDFLCEEIANPFYGRLVQAVWNGPHRQALLRSPATVADHHAYLSGLVEHTVSVTAICMAVADRHAQIDRELLAAGALLHDVGRALEIQIGDSFTTDERHGADAHILLAHEMLLEAGAASFQKDWRSEFNEQWSALTHVIAAHHGPADRARTHEANILLTANQLDARLSRRRA